ncbi:hypothetical protein D3C72_1667310 [compost metagenome]
MRSKGSISAISELFRSGSLASFLLKPAFGCAPSLSITPFMASRQLASSGNLLSVTPEMTECVLAPPNVSASTVSPIADFTK